MIRPATLNQSAKLAERLRKHIERTRPADGSLFMTEAEVAERYGVSRTVAREAVGRLRAVGLLEGRKRKGLIIRTPDPVQLFATALPSLAKSRDARLELAQLRYVLEVGSIELAVQNATQEQRRRLLEIAEQIKATASKRGGLKRLRQIDIDFHVLLLEMTGSKLVGDMQRVVIEFFLAAPGTVPPSRRNIERIIWEHAELAQAVYEVDIERARVVLRGQLRRYLTGEND